MAPFFPMENVGGKSFLHIIIRTRTHTQKQHSLCRKNIHIHPRDRQKRKKKRKKKKVFFVSRFAARKNTILPLHTRIITGRKRKMSLQEFFSVTPAATKLGHSLSFVASSSSRDFCDDDDEEETLMTIQTMTDFDGAEEQQQELSDDDDGMRFKVQ